VSLGQEEGGEEEPGQLVLFSEGGEPAQPLAPKLPELVPIAVPPLEPVRRLSFTALASFESCSYRYYAERLVGMKALRPVGGGSGMGALDVGDAVHRLLETIDLRDPQVLELERVRAWYPHATDEEVELIGRFVASYCSSELARRVAELEDVRTEVPFAFEHDGVLIRGFLDVLHMAGERALVVDYKTNALGESGPEEIIEHAYRLQRLVYALACFRAGATHVEVVYHFLERADAIVAAVFSAHDVTAFEAELSAAIARIRAGEFVPTPSEYACAGCPALDVVCAGPRLRGASQQLEAATA
jgi:hypothetical protein